MKLESQVCSLELAQKLKSLGVKQESLFYWDRKDNFYIESEKYNLKYRLSDETRHDGTTIGEFFSAFTVAELGEMLPPYFSTHFNKHFGKWTCFDGSRGEEVITLWVEKSDTEADCRAKMLIYLLENNLITL